MKRYKVVSSSSRKSFFFQIVPVLTNIPVWTPLSKTFAKNQELFPLKISKQRQINVFFSQKKSFVPECFSGHMESEVDNTAKTVSQRKRLFLAHCPKVEMFRFQPKFFLEMFRWSRRMPIWGICSFRASQSFHGLTTKRYDVVSLSKKFFQKFPLVTNILIWTHLSKTFAQKPGIFSPQNQQTESNFCFFFEKKPFV